MTPDPNKATLSDYTYVFRKVQGIRFLCIKDLNYGRMSVTNNIENIADKILNIREPYQCHSSDFSQKKNKLETKIIYCDSEGNWDGFNLPDLEFISLNQTGWLQAALKMIKERL